METEQRNCQEATEREASSLPLSPQNFDELYDRYKTGIFRFICHLTQDQTEAEDMFQEVWIRMIRHWPAREQAEDLRPWLLTVVMNLHRDMLRRKRVRRLFFLRQTRDEKFEPAEFQEPAALFSDPVLRAERAMLQQNINRAISSLPERQRRIFVLKEVEGLKQAEIAAILGIPMGTVKSLMHRAVKRLQRELAAHKPGGEKIKCDAKMLSV